METATSSDARTHFAALLRRVQQGETITITRLGVPVALLTPVDDARDDDLNQSQARATVAALREFRKGHSLGGISIRDLIEEGRRY
jgi:prevent-host-death family protein